jgi:outer membrane protein
MKNILFYLILLPFTNFAQDSLKKANLLTPDDAINIALEQNYGIRTAKLQNEVANLQVFKGNAGMLPKIDANTNIGGAFNNVIQKLSSGAETDRFATSFTPTANVLFSWVLFDGRKMYATFDKLIEQNKLSLLQTRLTMENTIANVLNSYYQIMLHKQTLKYLEQVIKQYEEVLKITDDRWQLGKGSKIDYLQAKNDVNAQISQLYNAQNALKNAKVALNQLLARNPQEDFEVLDNINITYNPNLIQLKAAVITNNKNLQILRKNADISNLVQKEAAALKLPRITLNSNYGYTLSQTNAGLFLLNQNIGLSAGVALSWNIFNGEITRRQIQTAKINTSIILNQQQDLQNQIEANIVQTFNQFQTNQKQLTLEEETNKIAEENLTIALQKFKLGASTILDIIQAQRSFDASLNRLVNARYDVKADELTLLILSGELVK